MDMGKNKINPIVQVNVAEARGLKFLVSNLLKVIKTDSPITAQNTRIFPQRDALQPELDNAPTTLIIAVPKRAEIIPMT